MALWKQEPKSLCLPPGQGEPAVCGGQTASVDWQVSHHANKLVASFAGLVIRVGVTDDRQNIPVPTAGVCPISFKGR